MDGDLEVYACEPIKFTSIRIETDGADYNRFCISRFSWFCILLAGTAQDLVWLAKFCLVQYRPTCPKATFWQSRNIDPMLG